MQDKVLQDSAVKRKSEGKPMSEADLKEWQEGWEEIDIISSQLKEVKRG